MKVILFGEKSFLHTDDGRLEFSVSKCWFGAGFATGKFKGPGIGIHVDAWNYARRWNLIIRVVYGPDKTMYELNSNDWPEFYHQTKEGLPMMVAPFKMLRNINKPEVKKETKDSDLSKYFG
jgi:hypothetical protein